MGEPAAGGPGLDDVGVGGEAVDDGGEESGIGEGLSPAGERLVGGDRDAVLLLAFGAYLNNNSATFRVSQSDSETFLIDSMSTKPEMVEWHLEMPWYSKGKSGVQVIDNDGKPFRVVGSRAQQGKGRFYRDPTGNGGWIPTGE